MVKGGHRLELAIFTNLVHLITTVEAKDDFLWI